MSRTHARDYETLCEEDVLYAEWDDMVRADKTKYTVTFIKIKIKITKQTASGKQAQTDRLTKTHCKRLKIQTYQQTLRAKNTKKYKQESTDRPTNANRTHWRERERITHVFRIYIYIYIHN